MNRLYKILERRFEKIASGAMMVLGNSITFFIALGMVIFWFTNRKFYSQDIHDSIGDVILGFTFLSLFVIQKSFGRFSASLHVKVNELVASHETADNSVINVEEKTHDEIIALSKIYSSNNEQIMPKTDGDNESQSADK